MVDKNKRFKCYGSEDENDDCQHKIFGIGQGRQQIGPIGYNNFILNLKSIKV